MRARAGEGCVRKNLLEPLHRGSRGGSGRGPACLSTKGSAPHAGARCSARAVAEHVADPRTLPYTFLVPLSAFVAAGVASARPRVIACQRTVPASCWVCVRAL